MLKWRLAVLLSALLIVLAAGCGSDNNDSQSEPAETQEAARDTEIFDSLVIVLQGQEGVSVFNLLLAEHEVDYIESAMGNFVNAIDSIEINNKFGWLYSVNGEMGSVASDKYITTDSDLVKWHYRKF